MKTADYPALSQFLGAYFHQDWRDEYPDSSAAVAAYRHHEPSEDVRAACIELDRVIGDLRQSSDPLRELYDLGCYFNPRAEGRSVCEWLASVRAELAST
jgi:hypothetical protein